MCKRAHRTGCLSGYYGSTWSNSSDLCSKKSYHRVVEMLINAAEDVNATDICHKRPPGSIFKSCVQNVGQTALIKHVFIMISNVLIG